MPLFVAALLGGLINVAGTIAGRVLLGLGFAAITYTGVASSIGWLKSQAITAFAGLPAQALGMMATMKIGESISILISALLVRQLLSGLTSDSIKRLVQR